VAHRWPCGVAFHVVSILRHNRFIGAKKAMSNGWVRCVEFGGKKTNLILCFLHFWMTFGLTWLARLSQMTTFFPGRHRAWGSKSQKN
jgi:hypothetical protein